jgi:hypothetical protein
MSIVWLDWFGYLASLVILISLTMSSIVKLRWINLVGAIMFSIFGYLIGSIPTGTLNLGIALIDIYYLIKLYRDEDDLSIVEIEPDSPFLDHFWRVNKKEIETIFKTDTVPAGALVFLYLRNNAVAGILVGTKQGDLFDIDIDYVVPKYRDLKIGQHFLEEQQIMNVLPNVSSLQTRVSHKNHEAYLKQVGFRRAEPGSALFTKELHHQNPEPMEK